MREGRRCFAVKRLSSLVLLHVTRTTRASGDRGFDIGACRVHLASAKRTSLRRS